MGDAKTIDQIVKERDWLAVERLRLFRLQRALVEYKLKSVAERFHQNRTVSWLTSIPRSGGA